MSKIILLRKEIKSLSSCNGCCFEHKPSDVCYKINCSIEYGKSYIYVRLRKLKDG